VHELSTRIASISDAATIARIHVDTWRSAYEDILPVELLERLSHDRSTQWWTSVLSTPAPRSCLRILNAGTTPVGFAFGGENRARDLPFEGELQAIYVLEEHQGKGGGRLLFDAVRKTLREAGLRSMLLWVLKNSPSRTFYERLGGIVAGQKPDAVGDTAVMLVAYAWRDGALS
jgi:GNAT superfamily N-acetyltransferase